MKKLLTVILAMMTMVAVNAEANAKTLEQLQVDEAVMDEIRADIDVKVEAQQAALEEYNKVNSEYSKAFNDMLSKKAAMREAKKYFNTDYEKFEKAATEYELAKNKCDELKLVKDEKWNAYKQLCKEVNEAYNKLVDIGYILQKMN